jgi:DNA-binding PadR family transcriptional regulator
MNLSDREMKLLAIVAFEELPGREIAQRYEKEHGRSIAYGTLYTTFRRLRDEKLVSVRDDEDADGRIRYFRITAYGKRILNDARDYHEMMATVGLAWGRTT